MVLHMLSKEPEEELSSLNQMRRLSWAFYTVKNKKLSKLKIARQLTAINF
jgi:hypothetical protein